jgi:choline dehydrogenase-like flavoprotein
MRQVTRNIDRRFDAVVIGSGAAGSIAVKELTERGMDVLLLEAGRDIGDTDFTPPKPKAPRPLGMDLDLRATAMLAGQYRQARRSFFSETSNRFLVNDRENPYSTPLGSLSLDPRPRPGRPPEHLRARAPADVGRRLRISLWWQRL